MSRTILGGGGSIDGSPLRLQVYQFVLRVAYFVTTVAYDDAFHEAVFHFDFFGAATNKSHGCVQHPS